MTTRRIAVSLIRNTRASSEGVNLNSRSETLLPFLGSRWRSRSRALVIVHVPPQPGSLHHRPALQALVHVPAHPRRRDARDGQPRHPIRVKVHPRRVVVAPARPRGWSRSQPMGPRDGPRPPDARRRAQRRRRREREGPYASRHARNRREAVVVAGVESSSGAPRGGDGGDAGGDGRRRGAEVQERQRRGGHGGRIVVVKLRVYRPGPRDRDVPARRVRR
mmetsp:Transcript_2958/g.11034  ORF Transcript_2958/g.11034 Transcript_2958/m.11034 type:complete len:220 (+) Transcript_2958:1167-1826(+)